MFVILLITNSSCLDHYVNEDERWLQLLHSIYYENGRGRLIVEFNVYAHPLISTN